MYGELVVTRHFTSGKIEVVHRLCRSMLAVYDGWQVAKTDVYKLYPRKGVLQRDVRFAGATVRLAEMRIEIPDVGLPAAGTGSDTPEGATKKTTEPKNDKKAEGRQISFFDRSYQI